MDEQKPTPPASLEDQIKELREVTLDTNKTIKAMRRDALVGGIIKTVIWLVVLVASFYYSAKLIEPYIGMLQGQNGASGGTDWSALIKQAQEVMGQGGGVK